MGKLLSSKQTKMVKSNGQGYLPVILHLQPYKFMGKNLCPKAGGCATVCLQYTGRMRMSPAIKARARRTALFWEDRKTFLAQLKEEIAAHVFRSERKGLVPCVRLNGTSDVQWEKIAPSLFTDFPAVQFWDYTKISQRMDKALPENYHLTFSQAENNRDEALAHIRAGRSVALVFRVKRGMALPESYEGRPVIDGDEHDLRFIDQRGVVVGLRSKGRAYYDQTGFVVDAGG